jgi:hypothetical protein
VRKLGIQYDIKFALQLVRRLLDFYWGFVYIN